MASRPSFKIIQADIRSFQFSRQSIPQFRPQTPKNSDRHSALFSSWNDQIGTISGTMAPQSIDVRDGSEHIQQVGRCFMVKTLVYMHADFETDSLLDM